jgi:hypothetical protein
MAVCKHCNQEMHEASGCILDMVITVDGPLEPVKYGSESDPGFAALSADGRRCGDCAALPGNYHHVGCDLEECPRCQGQLISCDCIEETDEEEKVIQ